MSARPTQILLALLGLASAAAIPMGAGWLFCVWAGLIVLLLTLARTRGLDPVEHRRLSRVVLISYAAFVTAILARYFAITHLDPNWSRADLLTVDGVGYDTKAHIIASAWRSGQRIDAVAAAGGAGNLLAVYIAVIYYFLGRDPLAPIALNALYGSLTTYYIYRISRLLFDEKTAMRAGLLAGGYPNLWLWAGMLIKDPLVTFIGCFTAYKFLRAVREGGILPVLQCALGIRLLFNLRIIFALVLAVAMAAQVLLDRSLGFYRYRLAVLGALIAAFALGAQVVGYGPFGVRLFTEAPVRLFVGAEGPGQEGIKAPGLLAAAKLVSTREALKLAGMGVSRFLLAPSAWYVPGLHRASEAGLASGRSATDYWTWEHLFYPAMWFWYYLIPPTIYGFFLALRRQSGRTMSLALTVGLMTLVYATVFLGSYRQRDSLLPLIFVFSAYGLGFRERYSVHYILLAAAFAVMIGVHLGSPLVGLAIGLVAGLVWLVKTARMYQERSSEPAAASTA